ncbi:type IV pilus biogenesis/stability protein PilW [Hydrogenophaga sp. IBVHS1]|jgi:type IV pilus assembly protein PilF|uniref:type IV pilus biogenesis/stability protein PilW n=1 Tax=Hydrogenophaga sp. IBVHS1 TaxID=1985169 RepID=UPI000A2D74E5|nr:type IV pilus biogenesis/stability protein PilW [Hydrogenophaga sp. IBVHS1]OSZ75166.1 type IV pilus biogenesis/stability protein PilW [Hydrogenophaga sp. IBVHS1]
MTQALRISDPSSRPWLPLPFSLLLALSLMALFAGCAQNPGAGSNTGAGVGRTAEPVTESDEPEARKRARIRLELAAGYFEQGQTTVALDEIKLSLAADPTYASAYMLRGLVYSRMNELPLAEESFRRAQQLNPRDPDVLHHYGLFACQQGRYAQAVELFQQAMASPVYGGQAKTLMAKGVCQVRAGQFAEAEGSLARSYELDAGNPITAYNLAALQFRRGENEKAQFTIRRLNNSDLANAETLWLGIKVERKVGNTEAMRQLAQQLGRRYPDSREWASYQRGAFDE